MSNMSDGGHFDDSKLLWIECYHIAVDALIAQPTDLRADTVRALKRGLCRALSDDEAAKLNAQFESQGDWAKAYLKKHLDDIRLFLARRAQP